MGTPDNDEGVEVGSVAIGTGSLDPRDFQAGDLRAEPDFYIAVLVIESSSDVAGHQPLFEESFVLIKAESAEEAEEKAGEYGKEQETSYHNENHELITWKLKQVVEVKPLEDATFDDGTELYSRFFRNYSAYRAVEPLSEEDV